MACPALTILCLGGTRTAGRFVKSIVYLIASFARPPRNFCVVGKQGPVTRGRRAFFSRLALSALITRGIWLKHARSNAMLARRLAARDRNWPGVQLIGSRLSRTRLLRLAAACHRCGCLAKGWRFYNVVGRDQRGGQCAALDTPLTRRCDRFAGAETNRACARQAAYKTGACECTLRPLQTFRC